MERRFIDAIDSEHPEYRAKKPLLKQYRDLYVGGEQIRANATDYLIRRQKEPAEVYMERLGRVFYENYVGSIIDWYVATLFRREPVVLTEGSDARGRQFVSAFAEDCDLRGTTLTEFFRKQMLDALVCGSSHIVVDFPRVAQIPGSLAEEDLIGTGRAYLSGCAAENLINWNTDERGEFEWVVIRHEHLRKGSPASPDWEKETRWVYYDKEAFQVYRRVEGTGDRGVVELVDEGNHGFARLGRVPVYSIRLPDGLWLMNKGGSVQLEHFNKSNALSWALTLGLFATPVIYSEREWNQIIGESYYIQLGPQDRFGWTEPEGKVYQIASDNLTRLQEEIYRVCYLLHQAGGAPSRGTSSSGASKQRDFAITQEVLLNYGDVVKESIKRILRGVVAARQDALMVDISGMDEFDIGDFGSELDDAQRLLGLGIESETLKKQVFKKLAFKYLCDVRQEVKEKIASEIDRMEA
jgi:hypothetical protein